MTAPVRHSVFAALRHGRRHVDPPAANRWADPASGTPVILLHGFGMDMATTWFTVAPALANAGLAVFALNYGQFGHGFLTRPRGTAKPMPGVGDAALCARELAIFVDRVRAATGANEVALVGHSFGGLVAQYYLKRLGGDAHVSHFVGLAPTVHGTTGCGLLRPERMRGWAAALLGENMLQQAVGSDFLAELYRDGDTVPGVDYTMISPRWDTFTTPIRSQRLQGERVANIRLRSRAEHLTALYDRAAVDQIVAALAR